MRFRKYHGAGNDFVMLEDMAGAMGPEGSLDRSLVASLCDRHTGIGADGLIRVVGPRGGAAVASVGAAARMDYYNADGLPAEMCGNGIRCVAVLGFRGGWLSAGEHIILTGAGPRPVVLDSDGASVAVWMSEPVFERADVPMDGTGSSIGASVRLDGVELVGTGVSMGNPHFVLFVDDINRDLDEALVHGLGPRLETHSAFPRRTNVEFVRVESDDEITMRVWERGVGETMACGSGACAAAAASAVLGRTKRNLRVVFPGGMLGVDWREDGAIWLSGPAQEVFSGELDAGWLRSAGR